MGDQPKISLDEVIPTQFKSWSQGPRLSAFGSLQLMLRKRWPLANFCIQKCLFLLLESNFFYRSLSYKNVPLEKNLLSIT